jgi:hypothetical protein
MRKLGPTLRETRRSVCYEDPSGTFPSPNSSAPTGFTLLAGSSNQFVAVPSSMLPIAGFQFTLNGAEFGRRQGQLHRAAGRHRLIADAAATSALPRRTDVISATEQV